MSTRGLGRWAAGLLLVGLSALGTWLATPTAQGASHDGACKDASGVTVVVDHQDLGGGVVVRCAQDFPASGGTGLLALQLAGFTPAGTVKDGAAFVCRINNRPAADEDLQVGGQAYRESCIATPPDGAFWSYWHAPAGGSWTFSQLGAARSVKPGGYEGWSFSLGNDASSNPAPGVKPAARPDAAPTTTTPVDPAPNTPARTTAAPPPASVTTPAPTGAKTSASTGRTSATTPTRTESSNSQAPKPTTQSPAVSSAPATTATPSASTSPEPTTSATASATATSDAPPVTTAESRAPSEPEHEAASSAPPASEPSEGGSATGTIVGVSAVAGIAVAAGGVLWWRRRQLV